MSDSHPPEPFPTPARRSAAADPDIFLRDLLESRPSGRKPGIPSCFQKVIMVFLQGNMMDLPDGRWS